METKVWVDAPNNLFWHLCILTSPGWSGTTHHGTTNDVLPDLEGERECGDEDTRKRYVMWRRTTLKIFHVLKHNEEICSAAEAPPGAALITRTTWSLKGCSYEYSKPSSTGVAQKWLREKFRENKLIIASFKINEFISVPSLLIRTDGVLNYKRLYFL